MPGRDRPVVALRLTDSRRKWHAEERTNRSIYGHRVGQFRVVLAIEENLVQILHVRRGTMDPATEDDLIAWQGYVVNTRSSRHAP